MSHLGKVMGSKIAKNQYHTCDSKQVLITDKYVASIKGRRNLLYIPYNVMFTLLIGYL